MKIQLFHRGEAIEVEVDGAGGTRAAKIGERRAEIVPITLDPSAGTVRVDGPSRRITVTY